jgi:mRNA-degrading endonuclease RelE of RelBE toxin-antitoxin system
MDFNELLVNKCDSEKKACDGCNSHFMELRPLLKEVIVSGHFKKDIKDEGEVEGLIRNILDCSHIDFNELHKFEESINGNSIFRAKRGNMHIVYCIDSEKRIIFLRALKNYDEYKKFLENKKEIERMVESLKTTSNQ